MAGERRERNGTSDVKSQQIMMSRSAVELRAFALVSSAWGWVEENGWYVLGTVIACAMAWGRLRGALGSARARLRSGGEMPSASSYQERQRLARRRQEEATRAAAEAHHAREREKRLRLAEERRAAALGG